MQEAFLSFVSGEKNTHSLSRWGLCTVKDRSVDWGSASGSDGEEGIDVCVCV